MPLRSSMKRVGYDQTIIPTSPQLMSGLTKLLCGVLAIGSLGIGPTAGLAAEDDALVSAARAEKRGIVYSIVDPALMQTLIKGFRDKYGVDIEVTRLTTGTLGQRLTAEADSGTTVADIVIGTDKLFVQAMTAKGYYAPIEQVSGAASFPAAAKTQTSVIVGRVPYSMIWNTNEVGEPPTSWQRLIDPKWKGRVMTIDPRVTGVSPTLWYALMRKTYGDQFLKALGQNVTFSSSAVPGMQQVAAGAQAIYAPAVHQITIGLKEKGAPVDEAFLDPTVASDNLLSVISKAPHPSVARLFAGYCLSVEGQALLNKDGFSMLPKVPGTRPMPQIIEIDPAGVDQPGILRLLGLL
jgi:iron(III) transport system substrate-binding protein